MHAVVVNVTINDREAAESELRDQLVPWASQTPGFVTGYWTIKDNTGLTMIMYESEDAANHMSGLGGEPSPSPSGGGSGIVSLRAGGWCRLAVSFGGQALYQRGGRG
jgi:hypothetical protein